MLHIGDLDCHVADLASEVEYYRRDTEDRGKKWLVNIIAGKTQLVLFD